MGVTPCRARLLSVWSRLSEAWRWTGRPCSRASSAVAARSVSSTVQGACGASAVVMRPPAPSRCRSANSSAFSRPSGLREEKQALPQVRAQTAFGRHGGDRVHREAVVGEAGHPATDHLGTDEPRAQLHVLRDEVRLDRPEDVVEPLLGRQILGHTAQGDHRGVGVAVDETGEGYLAVGVDALGGGTSVVPPTWPTDAMTPPRTTITASSTNPICSCSSCMRAVHPVMTRSAGGCVVREGVMRSRYDGAVPVGDVNRISPWTRFPNPPPAAPAARRPRPPPGPAPPASPAHRAHTEAR